MLKGIGILFCLQLEVIVLGPAVPMICQTVQVLYDYDSDVGSAAAYLCIKVCCVSVGRAHGLFSALSFSHLNL